MDIICRKKLSNSQDEMLASPALGSNQTSCECLLASSEAFGNTQNIWAHLYFQAECLHLSAFSAAGVVTCQLLAQQTSLIAGSGL